MKISISASSNPAHSFWSDFLIFRNSSSNVAVNRAAGDFPAHRHEFAEISLMIVGRSAHRIDGFSHATGQGDFIIAAPGSTHGYSTSSGFKRVNIQIRRAHYEQLKGVLRGGGFPTDLLDGSFASLRKKGLINLPSPAEFGECLRIAEEMEQEWINTPDGALLMLEIKLSELIVKLVRCACRKKEVLTKDNQRLLDAVSYLDRNYMKPISISRLEGIALMSKRTFVRRFKEATGLSPKQYHLKTRIAWASRKLSTHAEGIQQIATACGFDDQNYFARVFRKITGMSPREFAKRN